MAETTTDSELSAALHHVGGYLNAQVVDAAMTVAQVFEVSFHTLPTAFISSPP